MSGDRLRSAVLALVVVGVAMAVGWPHGDLANYVTAGGVWLEDPSLLPFLVDYRWFTARAEAAGYGDQLVGWPVLSPPAILLGAPLALLGATGAAWVWGVGQVGVALGAGVATARAVDRPAWIGLGALLATGPALVSHLQQGQMHLPVVVALAVGLGAWAKGRDVVAGIALGLAAGLKVHAWPVLLVAALARRWRVVGAGVATLLVGGAGSVALLGWPVHAVWLGEVAPAAARGAFIHPWTPGFGAVGPALRHALLPHPALNPGSGAGWPALAWGLPVALQGLATGLTLAVAARWPRLRGEERRGVLAAGATVGLLAGPLLARYHLLLVVPAVVFAVDGLARAGRSRRAAVVAGLAVLLCASPAARGWAPLAPALLRPALGLGLWAALVPWGALRPVGARGAAVLAAVLGGRAGRLPALDLDGASPTDGPTAPLVAAELLRTEDGALWFSGLPQERGGLPGRGWIGYRLGPYEAQPRPVAGLAGAHVGAPLPIGAAQVRWRPGRDPGWDTAPRNASRPGPGGGTLEVRAGDIWFVPATGPAVPLTTHPGHDAWPVWDPDRRRVWFLSDRGVGVRALRLWSVPLPAREE